MEEFELDFSGVDDEDAFYDVLEEVLPLPAHFDRDLEALYDLLLEYGESWKIQISGLDDAAEAMPAFVRRFRKACRNAMIETPGLEIEF